MPVARRERHRTAGGSTCRADLCVSSERRLLQMVNRASWSLTPNGEDCTYENYNACAFLALLSVISTDIRTA